MLRLFVFRNLSFRRIDGSEEYSSGFSFWFGKKRGNLMVAFVLLMHFSIHRWCHVIVFLKSPDEILRVFVAHADAQVRDTIVCGYQPSRNIFKHELGF